jgi:hypothetical protein
VLKNLKEKNSEPFIIFFPSVLVWWIKSHLLLFYLHAVDSLASGEDGFSDFMTDPDGMVQQGICCLSSIFSVLKIEPCYNNQLLACRSLVLVAVLVLNNRI